MSSYNFTNHLIRNGLAVLTICVGILEPSLQAWELFFRNEDFLLEFAVRHEPYGVIYSDSPNAEIKYEDITLDNPSIITYTFKNAGNLQLNSESYVHKISMAFDPRIKLIAILEREGVSFLSVEEAQITSSTVELDHQNTIFKGEVFDVSILVDNSSNQPIRAFFPKPKAEIKEATTRKIDQYSPARVQFRIITAVLTFFVTVLFVLVQYFTRPVQHQYSIGSVMTVNRRFLSKFLRFLIILGFVLSIL